MSQTCHTHDWEYVHPESCLHCEMDALRAENARLREASEAWHKRASSYNADMDAALEARDAAYERAAEVACPWCAGKGTYSRKPTVARDHEGLMHLAQGYPPRECRSAAIRALKAQPLPESEEERNG